MQRKCLRMHRDKYDVESKTRRQYCRKESYQAAEWFIDYIDSCWTDECGSDPEMTRNLVDSKFPTSVLSCSSLTVT